VGVIGTPTVSHLGVQQMKMASDRSDKEMSQQDCEFATLLCDLGQLDLGNCAQDQRFRSIFNHENPFNAQC
jgi:hypothetical protein